MNPSSALCPIETGNDLDELAAVIHARLRGLLREVALESCLGGIVLRGRACTYHIKQLAQHEVLRRGLLLIANEIVVECRTCTGSCTRKG